MSPVVSRPSVRRDHRRAQALSQAVRELVPEARQAMLAALADDELIVGGYADRRGRACPMLAAHRRGARVDVGSFPRAWDAFGRARRPRPASQRELAILKALLEEAGADSSGPAAAGAPSARAPGSTPEASHAPSSALS